MPRVRPLLVLLPLLTVLGCASRDSSSETTPSSNASPATEAIPGPEAKIQISYSHPNDYLSSMVVTKYSAAQVLETYATKAGSASVVRFDGGVTVWQFAVEEQMLAGVPMLGRKERRREAPKEVKYGVLPGDFRQSMPENGPAEPLEPNHYYVFAVTRGSGSVSYEAVKVNGDGSLEAYEADPRAGTSFRLCCDVAADFTITPAAP